jgi:hypothetical protein
MDEKQKLSGAIEVLLDQLKQQQQELDGTKTMINMLRRRMGEDPMFNDIGGDASLSQGELRPDAYYGKPLATAVQSHLERFKRTMLPEDILKGLEAGGYDFRGAGWKDNDRLRSLAIALSKNPKFHKLPGGQYGLTSWYDEVVLKKAEKAEKAGRAQAAADSQETADEAENAK